MKNKKEGKHVINPLGAVAAGCSLRGRHSLPPEARFHHSRPWPLASATRSHRRRRRRQRPLHLLPTVRIASATRCRRIGVGGSRPPLAAAGRSRPPLAAVAAFHRHSVSSPPPSPSSPSYGLPLASSPHRCFTCLHHTRTHGCNLTRESARHDRSTPSAPARPCGLLLLESPSASSQGYTSATGTSGSHTDIKDEDVFMAFL